MTTKRRLIQKLDPKIRRQKETRLFFVVELAKADPCPMTAKVMDVQGNARVYQLRHVIRKQDHKITYFGQVMRSNSLEEDLMLGTVSGRENAGLRPFKNFLYGAQLSAV